MSYFFPTVHSGGSFRIGRAHSTIAKDQKWCVRNSRRSSTDQTPGMVNIVITAVLVAIIESLEAFRGKAAVSPKWKGAIVNFGAFVNPAIQTMAEEGSRRDQDQREPSVFMGFWVLFGLSCIFDPVLQGVTPCYFLAKACVLAWGTSSARPYGGHPVLGSIFRGITDTDRPLPTNPLASAEETAARVHIPPRVFRFGLATVGFCSAVVAMGVIGWVAVRIERYFSKQPSLLQARVCIIVGTAWPIYATFRALGKAARMSKREPVVTTRKFGRRRSIRGEAPEIRQGPAAIYWLSYWPMLALLPTFLQPMIGHLMPHYYSVQLVVILFLAAPFRRGAHLAPFFIPGNGGEGELTGHSIKERKKRTSVYRPSDATNALVASASRRASNRSGSGMEEVIRTLHSLRYS